MGTLHASGATVHTDDHTLAHLAVVITAKLRRHEPFLLNHVTADGRESIWLHTATTLRYVYDSTRQEPYDRELLAAMSRDASRPHGLTVPAASAPAALPTVTA